MEIKWIIKYKTLVQTKVSLIRCCFRNHELVMNSVLLGEDEEAGFSFRNCRR